MSRRSTYLQRRLSARDWFPRARVNLFMQVVGPLKHESAQAYLRPSPFEVATSWVHGVLPEMPMPLAAASPRAAFEDALRAAVAKPPCFVSFSGGRDSSAILAVATVLARREGLADPIPVTEIYPGLEETDESGWQRLVVDHLGLSDWVRIPLRGENDLLGAAARAGLRRRGLIWPPAFQTKGQVLAVAAGGSLLTGEGGDDVIEARRITPVTLLVRKRRRPQRRLLSACAASVLPVALRRRKLRATIVGQHSQPWLRPDVMAEHARLLAADDAAEPLRWDAATWWLRHRRAFGVLVGNYEALAAEYGVHVRHPFLDEGFVAALARAGGRWGFAGRTALMRYLFADVLPDELLRRSTKASFDRAYMGAATREFARSWDGSGVDTSLVDPDVLRREWRADRPTTRSALLLQSAWLSSQAEPGTDAA